MGERLGGCGWAFFSFEVPDMPLTLCHRSLMDPDVPQCEQERTSLEQQRAGRLFVRMVNITAFMTRHTEEIHLIENKH